MCYPIGPLDHRTSFLTFLSASGGVEVHSSFTTQAEKKQQKRKERGEREGGLFSRSGRSVGGTFDLCSFLWPGWEYATWVKDLSSPAESTVLLAMSL